MDEFRGGTEKGKARGGGRQAPQGLCWHLVLRDAHELTREKTKSVQGSGDARQGLVSW